MSNKNFEVLLEKHIESIGIDKINEAFRKINYGPTNEEFFGEELYSLMKERLNLLDEFNQQKECFFSLKRQKDELSVKKFNKIEVFKNMNKYDSSFYEELNELKEVA